MFTAFINLITGESKGVTGDRECKLLYIKQCTIILLHFSDLFAFENVYL